MRSMALFLFFLSVPAFAELKASDPAWRALLHFSGSHSTINPKSSFFLAAEGFRDPAAELEATKKFFAENPEAPCRYPARALVLGWKKEGRGEVCGRWKNWREAIRPKGLELVFASAFLNSPASMYGHTLLKFPRAGKTEGEELLDYTLNYGANTAGTKGVAYVWMGLFGGFDGLFTTEPFYLKVKEYNFIENRDFWIYPVNVSPAEIELLLAHAWELRDTGLPYYFLRKNCSYYLLEFLEVARPGSDLTKDFPLWAVPLDTIRVLKERGWIGEPRFRPSRSKQLEAEWNELSGNERTLAGKLAKGENNPLPPRREAKVLDAAYDLWKYRNEAKAGADLAVEDFLLRQRSRYKDPVQVFEFRETKPENGHRSGRLGLGGGLNRLHAFGEIQYRGTFHDLLGPPEGYEPYSELSMGDMRARFEKGRFYLERFDVLRIRALSPRSEWFPRFAWSVKFGFDRAKEFLCADWRCSKGLVNGGGGISAKVGSVLFFALAEGDVEVGGVFDPNYRLAAGPSGGIFLPLWKGGRALAEAEYRWRILGEKFQRRPLRLGVSQTLHPNWELRAQGETNRGYREASAGLFHYF